MPFGSAIARRDVGPPGLRRGGRPPDAASSASGRRRSARDRSGALRAAGRAGHGLDDLRRASRGSGGSSGGRAPCGDGSGRRGLALAAGRAQRERQPAASAAPTGDEEEQDSHDASGEYGVAAPHRVSAPSRSSCCALAPALVIPMWTWSRCAVVLVDLLALLALLRVAGAVGLEVRHPGTPVPAIPDQLLHAHAAGERLRVAGAVGRQEQAEELVGGALRSALTATSRCQSIARFSACSEAEPLPHFSHR